MQHKNLDARDYIDKNKSPGTDRPEEIEFDPDHARLVGYWTIEEIYFGLITTLVIVCMAILW